MKNLLIAMALVFASSFAIAEDAAAPVETTTEAPAESTEEGKKAE